MATRSKGVKGGAAKPKKPQKKVEPKVLSTVGALARKALGENTDQLAELGARITTADDANAVHDMRVAARRLRAALEAFGAFLPPEARRLDRQLKAIFGRLGDVRDLDVEIEKLGETRIGEPEGLPALDTIRDLLARQRGAARVRLLAELSSDRYTKLLIGLRAVAVEPGVEDGPLAGMSALAAAPEIIGRIFNKLCKKGEDLTSTSASKKFHAVRKEAKRMRYTFEFFEGLYGKTALKFIDDMKALQDLLGARQDGVAVSDRLDGLLTENLLIGDARKLAKRIVKEHRDQRKECQAQFPEAFSRVTGKTWKQLEDAMEKRRSEVWQSPE